MKNFGYAMMFVVFAVFSIGCGDQGGAQPGFADIGVEVGASVELECSEHSDCFPDHKFCVNGTCVGDPQPECLPGEICDSDVVTEPDSGSVENDIDVPELTDSTVPVVDCYADDDCSYLEETVCDGIGEAQMSITGVCEDGVCKAYSFDVSYCETGCMNGGCLPESSCNDDSICTEVAGSYCTSDNTQVVYMGTGNCVEGMCQGFMKVYACTGDCMSNECLDCSSDTDCDDGDVCTDDQCVEGACVYETIDGCCNADSDCGLGGGCGCENDYWVCGGTTGLCVSNSCEQYVSSEYCDFGCGDSGCNECSQDTNCDDGDPCTDDYCLAGKCEFGVMPDYCKPCSDDSDCSGTYFCTGTMLYNYDYCNTSGLFVGTCHIDDSDVCLDGCDDGVCQGPQPECEANYECNDFDPCSTDTCVAGNCNHVPNGLCSECDDDNPCTYDIYKSNTGQCVHGYNMLAEGCCDTYDCTASCSADDPSFDMACDEFSVYDSLPCIDGTYQCCNGDEQCPVDSICIQGLCQYFECLNDSDCDDGDLETGDNCDYGKCFYVVADECSVGSDCDDSNPCTDDLCEFGSCVHQTFDCGSEQVCYALNEQYFACGWPCVTDQQCEDFSDNVCTVGICNDNGICKFSFDDGVPCDDGNACTTGNYCESGVCQPGQQIEPCCQSNDECTSLATCVGECVFNSLLVACNSEQDCNNDPICNDQYGGVYEYTGSCFATGFCEMVLHDDPEWGGTEGCFATQVCEDSSECELGGVCSKYVCLWIDGKPECEINSDCDDDSPCTYDVCSDGVCNNQLNISCVLCDTDADCQQAEPNCIDGAPLFQYYTECMPSGKCNVDVDYCANCEDDQCLDECTSDNDCSFGQYCTDQYLCGWTGDLQCKFYCPEDKPFVHIMYMTQEDVPSGELWTWPQEIFFFWGWCHPTFKFNCHDGANSWGDGNEAEVVCNAPDDEIGLTHLGDGLMQVELINIYGGGGNCN